MKNPTLRLYNTRDIVNSNELLTIFFNDYILTESIDSETTAEIEAEAETDDNDLQADEAALNKDIDEPESVRQSDEKPEEAEPDSAQPETDDEDDAESETAETDDDPDDLAEEATIETPVKKKSALKVAVSVIIIAAAFSGFFFFDIYFADNS